MIEFVTTNYESYIFHAPGVSTKQFVSIIVIHYVTYAINACQMFKRC